VVTDNLSIAGFPEVYVIGDLAHVIDSQQQVPGVAQAAIQMGHQGYLQKTGARDKR
jgi:NADH dehydrogenase